MIERPVLRLALPVPLPHYFDYLPPDDLSTEAVFNLSKGLRVLVPFGRRQLVGFLVMVSPISAVPREQLKKVIALLDEVPLLSPRLLQLLEWTSHYYHYPLGAVFATALPALLRRKTASQRRVRARVLETPAPVNTQSLSLNTEQALAVKTVRQSFAQFKVFLLQGVTNSGKTEVYLQLIEQLLQMGQQALLLVPEISLTPQTLSRLQQRFSVPIAVFHSGLSERRRLDHWQFARTGQASIVIGTRSAVFTPLLRPGLIILDEEHDSSFRQQDGLTYHARDLAVMRACMEQIPVVLGSATPAFESLWNASCGRYQTLSLPQRAGAAVSPRIAVVDIRAAPLLAGLSDSLLKKMQIHLADKGQVLLFLNRRGFAPLYLCHGCGWIAPCQQCDSPLRFHQRPPALRCHHCGSCHQVPQCCPTCRQPQLFDWGQGTQKLEQVLENYFPSIPCVRIDADSTQTKHQLANLLARIQGGEPMILIGTQILAKGHHFPGVTLAVVVDADAGLFSSDFRSLERSAQLMMQVAGRAGRVGAPGEVLIQTHHPTHPMLNQLIQVGYEGFSQLGLAERREAGWPPFSHLALLRAESRMHTQAMDFLQQVKQHIGQEHSDTRIWGPVPALMARRAGYYRAQLLFQSKQRTPLHQLLSRLTLQLSKMPKTNIRWSLEVDPLELG